MNLKHLSQNVCVACAFDETHFLDMQTPDTKRQKGYLYSKGKLSIVGSGSVEIVIVIKMIPKSYSICSKAIEQPNCLRWRYMYIFSDVQIVIKCPQNVTNEVYILH